MTISFVASGGRFATVPPPRYEPTLEKPNVSNVRVPNYCLPAGKYGSACRGIGGQASGISGVPQLPGSAGPEATTGAGGSNGGGVVVIVVLVVVVVVVGGDGVHAVSATTAATERNHLMLASCV
jgi:hypothetical protein